LQSRKKSRYLQPCMASATIALTNSGNSAVPQSSRVGYRASHAMTTIAQFNRLPHGATLQPVAL
jgi:hypothetical protein